MALQLLANYKSCRAKYCKSPEHYSDVVRASSKVPFEQAQTYLLIKCRNFWRLCDPLSNRSLVHWSAARGNADLLDWLIGGMGASFVEKDAESGYTPLHLAALHGQITCLQILLDYESSVHRVSDNEGLSVMELIRTDTRSMVTYNVREPTELYTFGENNSYNLGHSHPSQRLTPEPVDWLRRRNIPVQKVSMGKFHTMILGKDGQVYSCGHGLGGRLGLSSEDAVFAPKQLVNEHFKLPNQIVDVFAARNHSLFIDEQGKGYACGFNQYRQLGLGSTVKEDRVFEPNPVMMPKNVKESKKLIGCVGSSFHSVFWTNDSVMCCGLNAGQLGLNKEEGPVVPAPKLLGSYSGGNPDQSWMISAVDTSEAALVVAATNGYVDLWTNWERIKVGRNVAMVTSVGVIGGALKVCDQHVNSLVCKDYQALPASDVRVVVLTKPGHMFHWQQKDPTLRRIVYGGVPRSVFPTAVHMFKRGLLVVLPDGRAFKSVFESFKKPAKLKGQSSGGQNQMHRQRQLSSHGRTRKKSTGPPGSGEQQKEFAFKSGLFLDYSECQSVHLTRLPQIHRAVRVTCDPAGNNYGFIQQHPSTDLTDVPIVEPTEISNHFEKLYRDTDEFDVLHDLIIHSNERKYYLHKFIIFTRCPALKKLIDVDCETGKTNAGGLLLLSEWTWPNPSEQSVILDQFFQYLYTDTCALLQIGTKWNLDRGIVEEFQPAQEENQENLKSPKSGSKKKKKKGQQKTAEKLMEGLKSPVKKLQDVAKKYGLKQLTSKLESVKWEPVINSDQDFVEEGTIQHRYRVGLAPKLRFEPTALPVYHDIMIKCSDGKILPAHKCILTARLEYFRVMLTGYGWNEEARGGGGLIKGGDVPPPVTLPFESNIVFSLLYYAYTDTLPNEAKKLEQQTEFPERMCRILVSADQLLAERLRQLCESFLSSLISLRNVTELLEFSGHYNAPQLKSSCLQFICLNLCALLDVNGLEGLERESLDAVGRFYREMYPNVRGRVITPSSEPPNLETIQTLCTQVESTGVTVDELMDCVLQEFAKESSQPQNTPRQSSQKDAVGGKKSARLRQDSNNGGAIETGGGPLVVTTGLNSLSLDTTTSSSTDDEGFFSMTKNYPASSGNQKPSWSLVKKSNHQKKKSSPIPTNKNQSAVESVEIRSSEPILSAAAEVKDDNELIVDNLHSQPFPPSASMDLRTFMECEEERAKAERQKAVEARRAVVLASASPKQDGLTGYFDRRRRVESGQQQQQQEINNNKHGEFPQSHVPIAKRTGNRKITWCETPQSPERSVEASGDRQGESGGLVSLRDVMAKEAAADASKKSSSAAKQKKLVPPSQPKPIPTTQRKSWASLSSFGGGQGDLDFNQKDAAGGNSPSSPPSSSLLLAGHLPPQFTNNSSNSAAVGDGDFPSLGGRQGGGQSPPPKSWNQQRSFTQIQKEEENKERERQKRSQKPMWAIQMEEEAIAELLYAYGAADNPRELITVERYSDMMLSAEPVWKANI